MASAKIEFEGSKLAQALIKFQAELPDITLDAENPHFRSKFASLPNITRVVLPKLAALGIAFVATPRVTEEGTFIMEASLIHESGERESASFPITATDPQKVGSSVSYYRRYALASLTGIVADADDDGNAASLPTQAEKTATAAQTRVANAQANSAPRNTSGSGATTVDGVKTAIRVDYIEKGKTTPDEINAARDALMDKGKMNGAQANAEILKLLKADKPLPKKDEK